MTLKSLRLTSLSIAAMTMTLTACGNASTDAAQPATDTKPAQAVESLSTATSQADTPDNGARLKAILDAQDPAVKARYPFRNPEQTLTFFEIMPGMTVIEALPGGGWYSKLVMPYLGEDGHMIGADYSIDMWSEFGGFANDAFLEAKQTWPQTWTAQAQEWDVENAPKISAFAFGDRDTALDGTVDAALFIRAMHNLNRFADRSDYIGEALGDTHALLKPGGILGVVQHEAPVDSDDEWANGSNGYLKKAFLIDTIEAAGFEFIGESAVNANPKDQPTSDDVVWRLPPSYGTSRDDPAIRAKVDAIGESNRMTLKFKKI